MTQVRPITDQAELAGLLGHGQNLGSVRAAASLHSCGWIQWSVIEDGLRLYLTAKIPFVSDTPKIASIDPYVKEPVICDYDVYLEAQPAYSDRGRWLATVDWKHGASTLGKEDLFPRYYFNLGRALAEITDWTLARSDIREARKLDTEELRRKRRGA